MTARRARSVRLRDFAVLLAESTSTMLMVNIKAMSSIAFISIMPVFASFLPCFPVVCLCCRISPVAEQ